MDRPAPRDPAGPAVDPAAAELLTPAGRGAIAVILVRRGAGRVLARLTGRHDWPTGVLRLADLGGHDRGLAVRTGPDAALLMPHGGPAVTRAVLRAARTAGADAAVAVDVGEASTALEPDAPPEPGPGDVPAWPEADDPLEAMALDVMAAAASPLAFARLAEQPARWRAAIAAGRPWTAEDAARSRRLDRLLRPPMVVLAGPPNVGKSTLANALAGRTVALTADEPGTTRDAPSVRLDLAGLVVRWHDAPGLRATRDPVEREAVDRARRMLMEADLLVAAADAASDWPELPREPDLRVALRPDLGRRRDAPLHASGRDGTGLAALAEAVRDRLVPPADVADPGPWDADGRLRPVATATVPAGGDAAGDRGGGGGGGGGPERGAAARPRPSQKPIDETPQST